MLWVYGHYKYFIHTERVGDIFTYGQSYGVTIQLYFYHIHLPILHFYLIHVVYHLLSSIYQSNTCNHGDAATRVTMVTQQHMLPW